MYGVSIWKCNVLYLLSDDTMCPNWYPAKVFEVADPQLPTDWFLRVFADGDVSTLFGYEELVMDDSHFDDLSNRTPKAIQVFHERTEKRNRGM